MKKAQDKPKPAAARTVKLQRDQFDVLVSRMSAAQMAKRRFDLVQAVGAMFQDAQADLRNAQDGVVECLTRLGVDPAGDYVIDQAARTLTSRPAQRPAKEAAAPRPDGKPK